MIFIDYRKYAATNISTNLYVISEPWLYSLAWCAGAHSVATNAVHILKNLQRPLFLMVNDTHLQFSVIFSSCYWSFFLWLSSLSLPDAGWVQAYVDSYRHHFPYSCHDYLCVSLVSLKNRIYHISLWQWTWSCSLKSLCTLYRRHNVGCQWLCVCRWRERGLALSVDSSSVLENGSYRQFRTGKRHFIF